MAHRIKPREPKLHKRPNTIGGPIYGRVYAYHGTFEKVRLPLRPEDVFGQAGSATETEAGTTPNRRNTRRPR